MQQGLITYEGMGGLPYLIEANVPKAGEAGSEKDPKVKLELRAKSLDGFPLIYYVYAHDNPVGFDAVVDTSSKGQTACEITRVPYEEFEFEPVYYRIYKKKKRVNMNRLVRKLNEQFEESRKK